ncbi:MAG TPA: choice-of-anchor V domain-containing protein [Bacteroidia bacterium]
MKKSIILPLIGAGIIIASGFTIVQSSGYAYATNSPSDNSMGNGNCNGCHNGGSATPAGSITASPAFGGSGNNLTYVPGTTYTITVVQTNTSYSGYGFDIEIMNTNSASGTTDAGVMTALSTTYDKVNGTGPTNITHKTRIPTGTNATLKWVAPASGTAYLYAAILGENGNGSTSGDKVINFAYVLTAAASNPVPVDAFSTSSTSACVGQTITLTDNSTNTPTSWAWTMTNGTPASSTVKNPTVSYATAGTYTVKLVATNSGGSGTPVSHVITINALPTVTAPSQTICTTQTSATITASGATTYSWNTGGTTAACVVHPTTTTTYTVTGTNASGCKNTATSTITVHACGAGINTYAAADQINIYPNPANEFLNIDLTSLSGKKSAELYDVSGRLIMEKNTDGDSMQLNLAEVSNGSYFIKVMNDKAVVAVKMILIAK